jgi:hypothetical protein
VLEEGQGQGFDALPVAFWKKIKIKKQGNISATQIML